jgi:hypothetical protein
MNGREWASRLAAAVVVATLVLAAAAVLPAALPEDEREPSEPMDVPEYDAERLAVTPSEAVGEVTTDADGTDEVVVIDDRHSNRFDRAKIEPLADTLVRTGAEVRFYDSGELNESLEDADAFVVIDPGQEYDPEEIDAVQAFTGTGGRLFIAGEPNRKQISGGLFTTSLVTQESRLTTLGSAYGMSFDTAYLYNFESNDGNYEHVSARSGVMGVDEAALYTAAEVTAAGGTEVLVTMDGTRKSGVDETGRFTVGVRRNNVLAMGDSTFMTADRVAVAGNEDVLAFVVEFLLEGERVGGPAAADDADADADADAEPAPGATNGETNGTANGTATATEAPPA